MCAEQNVGKLKKMDRTKRRKSQQMDFQEFWDSCAQNQTSEISKMDVQEFWDSCAQNKTSEISKQ